jgi:hypothetical protein
MQLARVVERLNALNQLTQYRPQAVDIHHSASSHVLQEVHAANELHREEEVVGLGGDELVETNEVRVVDVCQRPKLLLEELQGRTAEVPQSLERDGAHGRDQRLAERPCFRCPAAPRMVRSVPSVGDRLNRQIAIHPGLRVKETRAAQACDFSPPHVGP